MEDEAVSKALSSLELKTADEEAMAYSSHRALDQVRRKVLVAAFPELAAAAKAYAVLATRGSATREFTVAFKGDSAEDPQVIMGACQITYEDLTPSECVEYAFAEAPDAWAISQISQGALETYRGMKFEAWKEMLVNPTCEAQFRRMLQLGMVSELYDPQVFPTPASQKSKYQATDERTGKLLELPHPVKALRVWDAATQAYTAIESRLKGAPSQAETSQWWASFMEELHSKHGAEYIAGLLANK